ALGAIHVPINGALGARIQSTVAATFVFYGMAFLVIAAIALLSAERAAFRALPDVPLWYLLLPGLISVAVVGGNTFLIPRFGAINVFVVAVFAQTTVRVVISHFGWLESPVDPISASKLAGAGMVALGAILVVRP
ncbi:MAG TPA: DMT family transporter, partial [Myxococcota bacterium]|nr:DMT family transporter [Myxococcota bacterium]